MVRLEQMILGMRERGSLTSDTVEDAFRRIPRHLFVKGESVEVAYVDAPVPIEERGGVVRSSISAPSTVAAMLEQLGVSEDQTILEIGAGTGYNAALMAHLAGQKGHVTTIEISPRMAKQAGEDLRAIGIDNVEVITGDGALGYASGAPYDRIMLTVGAADIAPAWIGQLAMGGVLLIPLWIRGEQLTVAFKKTKSGLVSESIRQHGFVRLRGQGAGGELMLKSQEFEGLAYSVERRKVARGTMFDRVVNALTGGTPSGVTTGPHLARTGLMPWLALQHANHSFMIYTGKDQPPIPALCRMAYGAMTSALFAHGEAAILGLADPATQSEVMVYSTNPDSSWAKRTADSVKEWDSAGQPTLENLRLSVPAGGPARDKQDCYIRLKSGMVLGARWVRGTPVTTEANRARGGSQASPAR